MDHPFDLSGIELGDDGIRRYTGLAQNLVQMLRAVVEATPGATALVELGGERLTYAQLWDRSARVAGGLRAAGVQAGDRVANHLGNGNDWVLVFWGTAMAGAISVPVNTRLADPEVAYVVSDSGSKVVVEPGEGLPDGEPHVDDTAAHTDVAAIFYTSGTTGFPKGAMTTHENFLSNVETCLRCLGLDRESLSTLISVPLFHVTGCNSQMLVAASVGGCSVIMPTLDMSAFLAAIETERISVLTTVPALYWLMLNHPNFATTDTSSVRALSYGGAPIAPSLVHQLMQSVPTATVGNGFGLSETSSVSTFLPHAYAAEHADSVGFPAPVVDVAVAEKNPETGVGELLIRGPHVVPGYWGKPELSAEAFVDGWLHSGDLARIDDDGLVYIVDRVKDMINRGGENVYCVEVENALAAHPEIGEVAVVGVPDEMMGEKVGAVVVPRGGATVSADDVRAFAAGVVADFKVPQYVVVRSEPLPRNPGGKVVKSVLRAETDWGPLVR